MKKVVILLAVFASAGVGAVVLLQPSLIESIGSPPANAGPETPKIDHFAASKQALAEAEILLAQAAAIRQRNQEIRAIRELKASAEKKPTDNYEPEGDQL